jgi:hypothetical protein
VQLKAENYVQNYITAQKSTRETINSLSKLLKTDSFAEATTDRFRNDEQPYQVMRLSSNKTPLQTNYYQTISKPGRTSQTSNPSKPQTDREMKSVRDLPSRGPTNLNTADKKLGSASVERRPQKTER